MITRHLLTAALASLLGAAACSTSSTQAPGTRSAAEARSEAALLRASNGNGATPANQTDCSGSTVFFRSGSSDLDEQDRQHLRALAQCMEAQGVDTLYVVGRTDPVGSPGFNRDLGRRRAAAVADYLQQMGARTNFVVKSRGEHGAAGSEVLWPYERATVATPGSTP